MIKIFMKHSHPQEPLMLSQIDRVSSSQYRINCAPNEKLTGVTLAEPSLQTEMSAPETRTGLDPAVHAEVMILPHLANKCRNLVGNECIKHPATSLTLPM